MLLRAFLPTQQYRGEPQRWAIRFTSRLAPQRDRFWRTAPCVAVRLATSVVPVSIVPVASWPRSQRPPLRCHDIAPQRPDRVGGFSTRHRAVRGARSPSPGQPPPGRGHPSRQVPTPRKKTREPTPGVVRVGKNRRLGKLFRSRHSEKRRKGQTIFRSQRLRRRGWSVPRRACRRRHSLFFSAFLCERSSPAKPARTGQHPTRPPNAHTAAVLPGVRGRKQPHHSKEKKAVLPAPRAIGANAPQHARARGAHRHQQAAGAVD